MGKQVAERLHRPGLGRRRQWQACQQRQQACESVVALLRRGGMSPHALGPDAQGRVLCLKEKPDAGFRCDSLGDRFNLGD